VSDTPHVPAAVRYKEITAVAVDAAERMRRHEADKADRLTDEVAAGQERIAAAEEQKAQVAEGVRVRWSAAMEALWDERWMRVTPMPDADLSAAPATPEESIRAVQGAFLELHEALGKARWSAGSMLPRRGRREG
jgi:hypothetical protein